MKLLAVIQVKHLTEQLFCSLWPFYLWFAPPKIFTRSARDMHTALTCPPTLISPDNT